MDTLGSLINKVLKKRGLHGHALASQVVHTAQVWLNNALPECIDNLRVNTFKDGQLSIKAQNSIAAQECQTKVEDLKQYLLESLPDQAVESIRITRS